jgi:hypothetical protein
VEPTKFISQIVAEKRKNSVFERGDLLRLAQLNDIEPFRAHCLKVSQQFLSQFLAFLLDVIARLEFHFPFNDFRIWNETSISVV